jgi:hypothetical protein
LSEQALNRIESNNVGWTKERDVTEFGNANKNDNGISTIPDQNAVRQSTSMYSRPEHFEITDFDDQEGEEDSSVMLGGEADELFDNQAIKPAANIKVAEKAEPEQLSSPTNGAAEKFDVEDLFTLGVGGLGAGALLRILSSNRNVRAEAAHAIKPIEGSGERPRIDHQGESFEVKGQARDGRILIRSIASNANVEKTPGASTTPGTADGGAPKAPAAVPFAEVTPNNFNPTEGKFGEFTPIKVDGDKYYASKDGVVFKFEGGKLVETAQTRALHLIPESDYKQSAATRVAQPPVAFDAPRGLGTIADMPPQKLVMMDSLPQQTSDSTRTAEANRKVNEILQPLRERLKAGEQIDAATKETYFEKARDVLHPIANETAKLLGLPPVRRESIRFEALGPGGRGGFNRKTGDVLVNLTEESPVTVIDHELKHKQRHLDMAAANKADPLGFRYALLDACLADIGKPSLLITEVGVKQRKVIRDSDALNEFKQLVKREVDFHLAETGLLSLDKVLLDEPQISKKLLAAFGGDRDAVMIAAMEEREHFAVVEKQNVLSPKDLDSESREYIEQKAAQFKRPKAESEKPPAEGAAKDSSAEPAKAKVETPFHEKSAIRKLVEGIGRDTLGYFGRVNPDLATEYQFSGDETGSRKLQAAQELKRLRKELLEHGDTTKLADNPRGKVLLAQLELVTQQQLMIKHYREGNMPEARKYAESVFAKMCLDPQQHNMADVLFLNRRGLISSERVMSSAFAPSSTETERFEQQKTARNIIIEQARSGKISGDNLEAPIAHENPRGLEYKLKTPAIVERGTDTESKVVSLIQLPDGKLVAKYVDSQSAKRHGAERPVVDEFYGDNLLSQLSKKVDLKKLSAEQRVKLASDFIVQIQTEEFLGDTNKGAVAQVVDGKPSIKSDIQNPESRDLVRAGQQIPLVDAQSPLLDVAKFTDFRAAFDAWHDAVLARREAQKLRDSHSSAILDIRTPHVRERMRTEVAQMDRELAAKAKEIERLRKTLDGKAAGLSDRDAAAFERQFAIESVMVQQQAAQDLARATSTGEAAKAAGRAERAVAKQGAQLRALLGPRPEAVDPSVNAADNPNAHPNFRLEDIARKRRTADYSLTGSEGLEAQLESLKSKGSFGQWWNKGKIAGLETRVAAAKAEVIRLDSLAASLREGVIADLKPGDSVTIGKQGEVRLTEGHFRSKHASIAMREDGSLELRDGTDGKPSNRGVLGEDGRPMKDFGTFIKRTARDGTVTYDKVSATTPAIIRPGDEIFIGRDPKTHDSRSDTMKITVPESKSRPGTNGGANATRPVTGQAGEKPSGDPLRAKETAGVEKAPGAAPSGVVDKSIDERIAAAPKDIQPGLLKIKEHGSEGWETLAADIISLHEKGKLPTRACVYLDTIGSTRVPDKVELLRTIVATAISDSQPAARPASSGTASGGAAAEPGSDVGASKDPVTERHDVFGFSTVGSKAKDLLVRVSYTGPDQVTVEKMVPLLEVPPEELKKRLDGLTKEKIAEMLAKGENELKRTEGESKFAEERKALEAKLESLRELQKIHEGYETAKQGGRELEFCKDTQARLKGAHGSHPGRTALAIAGKAGLASALLLLFNDLVPEVKLGGPSISDRVNPGSSR